MSAPALSAPVSAPRERARPFVSVEAGHHPALDGLRGSALLSVILFHTAYVAAPSTALESVYDRFVRFGWVGVDAFFALSGYLITSILLRTRGAPSYFQSFYMRRALRIFPLYFIFLLIVHLIALQSTSAAFATIRENQLWYWTYTGNIAIALRGTFDVMPANTSHLWSLALEEQFYLVWPAVVALLGRARLQRACVALVVGGVLARTAFHVAGASTATRIALYVSTPTRLDALMAGAFIATLAAGPSGITPHLRWLRPAGVAGLATATACHIVWGRASSALSPAMQTAGYVALAICFASLVAECVARPAGRLARALENSILRRLGRYSYAMYLFHYPLAYALSDGPLSATSLSLRAGSRIAGQIGFFAIVLTLSTSLAALSWWLVESRFLKLKSRYAITRSVCASP